MTRKEICELQQACDNRVMYLLLEGTFWKAFNGGAFALARVMGYQIKRVRTTQRYEMGFSRKALEKVIARTTEEGFRWQQESDGLYTFSGGDTTVDDTMVVREDDARLAVNAHTGADYQSLCMLRKQLLDINLADTDPMMLPGIVRELQMNCLAHFPMESMMKMP